MFQRFRTDLRLNLGEQDHFALSGLLDKAANLAVKAEIDPQGIDAFGAALGEIVTASRAVLKTEWERVKRGE